MKISIALLSLIYFHFYQAQYGIGLAIDTTGYVNIRSSPKIADNLLDSIRSESVIFCYDKEGNWTNIDFHINGEVKNGYIHNSRIYHMDTLENPRGCCEHKHELFLKLDDVAVFLKERQIEANEIMIEQNSSNKEYLPPTINGQEFWGTDGGYPTIGYEMIRINEFTYDYNSKELSQYFQPNFCYTKLYGYGHYYYLVGHNSDGGGSYTVFWKILNGKIVDHQMFYGF